MELQNTANRIARESKFLHCLLDGVVFHLALLFGTLWEVEVELWVEYLPILSLGGNVAPIYLRTDSDTRHVVLLLNFFWRVPFNEVGIYLVFGRGCVSMFLTVVVELMYSYLRYFILPCASPYPFGIDLIFFCSLFSCVILRDVEILLGQGTPVRFDFHHRFNVRMVDEQSLAADAWGLEPRFLYQLIYVSSSYIHQLCNLGKRREILSLGGLPRL